MIVTVFGDVHGNLIALEKLLKTEGSETDLFVSHGDVVNYGPWSDECVNLLSDIPNIQLLQGNHEQYFIQGNYPGENLVAQSFFDFCFPKFKSESLKKISEYGEMLQLDHFTIQHTIDERYIFSDTDISDITLEKNYIIGHSHQQYTRLKNNFKLYNTGSVGQNRSLLNQSNYLKIDTESGEVQLKSFLHDVDQVINEMKAQQYPEICINYYLSKNRQ